MDDDVMAAILAEAAQHKAPGLAAKRRPGEQTQPPKSKKARKTEVAQKVVAARDKGLNTAIGEDNKGFALLAKMGYKSGQGLGKQGAGIVEPIGVTIKQGRTGLGHEDVAKQRAQKRQEQFEARRDKALAHVDEFRERAIVSKVADRRLLGKLRHARRVVESIDTQHGAARHALWPPEPRETLPGDEEEEDGGDGEGRDLAPDPAEALEMVTAYLRSMYNYCFWCAVEYDDADDRKANCPGDNEADH